MINVSSFLDIFIGSYGIYLLWSRLKPRYSMLTKQEPRPEKKVSIIIPARDEENNLKSLSASLKKQKYNEIEIIGVNDGSTDDTANVLESFCHQVIHLDESEKEWSGKSWACHKGSERASGEYLLFIDADVVLKPESIELAMKHAISTELDLMSAVPEHILKTWWDQACAIFHLLLYSSIRPFEPQKNWLYANGQFLLFKKSYYDKSEGHKSIGSILAEDLALANQCLENKANYGVYPKAGLYQVRMYETLYQFILGWRRNFHLGFKYSNPRSSLDVFCMLYPLLACGSASGYLQIVLWCLAISMGFVRYKEFGNYKLVSFILNPVGILLFIYVSLLAVFDKITKMPLKWKGREYAST